MSSKAVVAKHSTVIHKRVDACRAGTYEKMICRVKSGWVVLGDVQFLHGYSLILPDPVVSDLNALSAKKRQELLYEASVVGDALLHLTDAVRINYEILGNLEPALHVHIFPRFSNEPSELLTKPVWFYDWEAERDFDVEKDKDIMTSIGDYLEQAGLVQ